jgi:IPT/TIG domain-containing protein
MKHLNLVCTGDGRTIRNHGTCDESGSVLVLALVYLVAVSLIVGGLTDWAMNDLGNTSGFSSSRSLQTAATSATETAMQSVRYTPLLFATSSTLQTLNASPPEPCWGTSSGLAINSVSVNVWCSTVWNPTSALTRVVTFSTCLSTMTNVQCAAQPLLQAVVTFDDYPPGIQTPTSGECVVFCGTSLTVESWLWSPAVPAVQSISWASTPTIIGGTTITVNAASGASFVSNATSVDFVEETGLAPVTTNVVIPCTTGVLSLSNTCVVSGVSSNQLTVSSPPISVGATYFVTVTTPGGTSAYGASDILTYSSAMAPSVSLVGPIPIGNSTAGGSTSGGTPVTITGSGYFSGATVNFVPVGGGTGLAATSVSVVNPDTITAYSPPAAAASYYVVVRTPGGSSATGTSDVFTYAAPIPNPA